ncbi:MAG: AI-2E family transporter [Vampirovibrionales bacterium]|nr:AI-2E family transporter [Vampirovibrionales bacterium]
MSDSFDSSAKPARLPMPTWLKIQLIILSLALLLYGALYAFGYFMPIFVLLSTTLLLTYVLLGAVDWMALQLDKLIPAKFSARRFMNLRVLAIISVYLIFGLCILLLGLKSLPPLVSQVKEIARDVPTYSLKAEDAIRKVKPLSKWYRRLQHYQRKQGALRIQPSGAIQESPNSPSLDRSLDELRSQGLHYVVDLGGTTLTTVIYALTMLVLIFYLLLDGQSLKRGFVKLLPPKLQGQTGHYLSGLHLIMNVFVKTQLVLALLAGVSLYIVYNMLGVQYALFLSFFYALVSIVPVIGPWFGMLPTLFVVAFSDQPIDLIPIIIFLSAFYLLKVYWIIPKLFKANPESRALEIHPVLMIITVLACIQLGKLPGIILAFPIAVLVGGTQQYLLSRKLAQGQYR